jgi:hypothetical protein
LFNRLQVPDFKSDEIEWEKKKSSQTVHEQYLKLLIKGVHVITGLYATSSFDAVCCLLSRSTDMMSLFFLSAFAEERIA